MTTDAVTVADLLGAYKIVTDLRMFFAAEDVGCLNTRYWDPRLLEIEQMLRRQIQQRACECPP